MFPSIERVKQYQIREMKRLSIIFLFGLTLLSFFSCSISRKGYSYNINHFSGTKDSMFILSSSELISYKSKYIIEFLEKNRYEEEYSALTGKTIRTSKSEDYDVSFYHINDTNYFLIDTFSQNFKILKYENISKKENGLSIRANSDRQNSKFGYDFPRDTTINGKRMYYIDTTINNIDTIGALTITLFFLKMKNLYTYINVRNTIFSKTSFSFIGFSQFLHRNREIAAMIIQDVKGISKTRAKICKKILKETRQYKNKRKG